jgi:nucleoid DNA-binding protein
VEFVDMVFEVMAKALERKEKIKIQGGEVFNVREKRARTGRNLKTVERKEISAFQVVTFKSSGALREILNRGGK